MAHDNIKLKLLKILESQGYTNFIPVLDLFEVETSTDKGLTAAIDVDNYIIYINVKNANKSSKDKLSFLVRHELLHKILDHQKRAYEQIMFSLGYDPKHITKKQFRRVEQIANQPSLLYREYCDGNITLRNGAADLESSKSYIKKDIEITEKMHGLLIQHHPGWGDYTLAELFDELAKEERNLRSRLATIIHGEFVDEHTFIETGRDEPKASTSLDIDPNDITENFSLPSYNQLLAVTRNHNQHIKQAWVSDPPDDTKNIDYAYAFRDTDYKSPTLFAKDTYIEVHPKAYITNYDFYKKVQQNNGIGYIDGKKVMCFSKGGSKAIVIFIDSVFSSQFDLKGSPHTGYNLSALDFKLEDYLKKIRG